MNDTWNNEVHTNLTIVTPPRLFVRRSGAKIFLGGSIDLGNAPDWQGSITKYIDQSWGPEDVTVYNPRRLDEFTSDLETEQAAWTISMLTLADYILLHLAGEGASPISTLELGMFIDDPRLYLSIDDEYTRKEIIEYHYNCFGIGQIYASPKKCIDAMKYNWRGKD